VQEDVNDELWQLGSFLTKLDNYKNEIFF